MNRGAAYWEGKIIYNTLGVQTVAVDANTGKQAWKTKLGDTNLGASIAMAPIVTKDVVLVGNSGGEFGVRGWLAGPDANTGKLKWRAYATGSDKEVLIGPHFNIYIPHNNLCYETQGLQANYIAGTPFVGMNVRMYAGPGGNRAIFSAWDPVQAKTVWSITFSGFSIIRRST